MADLPTTNEGLEKWLIESFIVKNKMISDFRISKKFPDPLKQPLVFPAMDIPATK
jgi:hypothetical protein